MSTFVKFAYVDGDVLLLFFKVRIYTFFLLHKKSSMLKRDILHFKIGTKHHLQ